MIIQLFELRCDDCNERFEDFFDFSIVSHGEVRAEAKKRGWVRRDTTIGRQDFCPQCKGKY
jgi:hypothetical protein